MAVVDLIMPKMGESIMEATILKWVKQVGDMVELDETILEIATDKVDSEIPSPVEGKISEILFKEDDVVQVGTVIAKIATEAEVNSPQSTVSSPHSTVEDQKEAVNTSQAPVNSSQSEVNSSQSSNVPETVQGYEPVRLSPESGRFYSPLVRNIAAAEGISIEELDQIPGSGLKGRVTKNDIKGYVEGGKQRAIGSGQMAVGNKRQSAISGQESVVGSQQSVSDGVAKVSSLNGMDEIVQMDRMRKIIADHMVMSKQTSPHVTSFVEADVTNLVNWRNKVKGPFQQKHNEKITFTPIFIEAVAKAIRDYPMVNVSVDGDKIIVKKNINIGMATALPSGNLIVPVIKNADQLNMTGLTKAVNDLAARSRINKLKPEDIQGGTFTLTNVGTFGNVMGTPIINQPQVAVLAVGAIRKKPAVVETEYGDLIAVRQMMFLSLSYDHRVVDGFLGGSFLRRVADYLEQFDSTQTV